MFTEEKRRNFIHQGYYSIIPKTLLHGSSVLIFIREIPIIFISLFIFIRCWKLVFISNSTRCTFLCSFLSFCKFSSLLLLFLSLPRASFLIGLHIYFAKSSFVALNVPFFLLILLILIKLCVVVVLYILFYIVWQNPLYPENCVL